MYLDKKNLCLVLLLSSAKNEDEVYVEYLPILTWVYSLSHSPSPVSLHLSLSLSPISLQL